MGTGADTTIVRYKTGSYPTSTSDGSAGYSGSGTSCTISSLSPSTVYYFVAWSSKTAGGYTQNSSSSAQVSQATVATPTIATGSTTNIADTSATCGGNITSTGGVNATSRGIYYGTTTGYGSTKNESGSFGIGTFPENLTGLSAGTLYHYQAFATNNGGTGTGSDATFLTLPDAPTGFIVTAETTTSVSLSWAMGTGADTTIVRYKIGSYPTSTSDGTAGYSGSGISCTISSLSPSTVYYFAAWSSKTAGGYIQYSNLSAQVSQTSVDTLELTAPSGITNWSLVVGSNPFTASPGSVNTSSSKGVTVKVQSNNVDGKMTNGPYTLGTPLSVTTGSWATGATVTTTPTTCLTTSGPTGASIPLSVSQTVTFTDPSANGYSIILTYTATLNP
jgi:hypothetical protein